MEIDWQKIAEQIDSCQRIEVRSIEVTAGFGLRLIVGEFFPPPGFPENPERDFVSELATKIRSEISKQIVPDARCFEIVFDECISYTVVNETYGRYPEPPVAFTGKLFRVFSWSHLLELTRKTTYASDHHPSPGPMQHYEIATQEEIVDIIACVEPKMRLCDVLR